MQLDLMLEVFRNKVLLYQSLLPEPVFVRAPGELVFEISVDSSILPDQVYRLRVSALLMRGDTRFVSRGVMHIATKNCGPALAARAKAFTKIRSGVDAPLSRLDLVWSLVSSQDAELDEAIERAAPELLS